MADDPGPASEDKPEPPKDQKAASPESDDFVTKLRKALPDLLDELLGTEEPQTSQRPTLRDKEESVRDQVARAVRELEEESRGRQKPEVPAAPASPPKPETKPWRERFWS